MLLSETLAYLQTHPFRPDAKLCVSYLPLSGIYWDDELDEPRALFKLPDEARAQLLYLFSLRYLIWSKHSLLPEQQQFWDDALRQAPDCALFQRLEISEEHLRMQQAAEQNADTVFHALESEADSVTITPKYPGFDSYSLAFALTKSPGKSPIKPNPWWKRIFR